MRLIDADIMKGSNDIVITNRKQNEKYITTLNNFINSQPTVLQFGEWISTGKSLPTQTGEYLTFSSDMEFGIDYYDAETPSIYVRIKEKEWCQKSTGDLIAYWMPLPERPE